MRYFKTITLVLLLLQPAHAVSKDTKSENDKVSIGYIPSRGAVFKGEPYKILEAKSLPHHKNKEIKEFHVALKRLASDGITDNSTQFHQPMIYIETIYQGDRIRLFYNDDTNLEKFDNYEKNWKMLHGRIYRYLMKELSPGKGLNAQPQ